MSPAPSLAAARERGTPRPIVTPEGVELQFVLARGGDRLAAFLLDSVLMFLLLLALGLVALFVLLGVDGAGWLLAVVIFAAFLLQNFYFIYFESRRRGMTPGKRRMGIRVMEADGGTLTASAIVVRNVMRNLEVYVPLVAVYAPEQFWPGAPGWARLLASVWLLVIAGMPLFNRRRLRVGDMVAGTIVVVAPQAVLLADLGSERVQAASAGETAPRWRFSDAQLDVYGEYELQVLEDLLRNADQPGEQRRAQRAVQERITRKIDWQERIPARDTEAFLLAFYQALRARLEQKLLFGRRKKDKFSDPG